MATTHTDSTYHQRMDAWRAKRDRAFTVLAGLIPVPFPDGEATEPFEAVVLLGSSMFAGPITSTETVKIGMNRHGWPIVFPCHADGRKRALRLPDGSTRRQLGPNQLLRTRAIQ